MQAHRDPKYAGRLPPAAHRSSAISNWPVAAADVRNADKFYLCSLWPPNRLRWRFPVRGFYASLCNTLLKEIFNIGDIIRYRHSRQTVDKGTAVKFRFQARVGDHQYAAILRVA